MGGWQCPRSRLLSENHSQHKHVLGFFLQMTHNQQNSKDSKSSISAVPLLRHHGNPPVPQGWAQKQPRQTDTHAAPLQQPRQDLLREMQKSLQLLPELPWLNRGTRSPHPAAPKVLWGNTNHLHHAPQPLVKQHVQQRKAMPVSLWFFPLCLCLFLSLCSTHRSLSATAIPPAPSSTRVCSPFTSILLVFGVRGP